MDYLKEVAEFISIASKFGKKGVKFYADAINVLHHLGGKRDC